MSISRNKLIIIGLIILSLVYIKVTFYQSYHGPAAISDPIQVDQQEEIISHVNLNNELVNISLVASYEGSFGVKGVKKYTTDGAAEVSPRDFVLAWGELLKEDVDEHIKYSQSNRWYHYTYSKDSLVTGEYISQHSANTHTLPANKEVLKILKKVKKNDYITTKGYLAIVHFDTGDWGSSMTRVDTGDGACEIYYITEIIIH